MRFPRQRLFDAFAVTYLVAVAAYCHDTPQWSGMCLLAAALVVALVLVNAQVER